MEDYRILGITSIILRIVGWVQLAYGIIAAFIGLFGLELGDGTRPAIAVGLEVALRGLLLLAAGETIRMLLRMNERSQIQERRYRQLDREREHTRRSGRTET